MINEVREVEGDGANANPVGNTAIARGRVAYADTVESMPTRWFGYGQIDLMILSTSNQAFVEQLMNRAEKSRQEALSEWVRRGGRLVISAGRYHNLAAALLKTLQMDGLPVAKDALILIKDKAGKIADLKKGMRVTLVLGTDQGQIVIKSIKAE